MQSQSTKQFLRILATFILLGITDFGDYLESLPDVVACPKFHAVLDNMIHLWIGVLTWTVLASDPGALTFDLMLVALGSSLIDLDHFLAAGSWSVDDAMHAPHRGIFHCTGLMLIITGIIYRFVSPHLALLLFVAFLPHHLRDAQRRGLYLVPFYPEIETRPVPTGFVRLFLPAFPWIIRHLVNYVEILKKQELDEDSLIKVLAV